QRSGGKISAVPRNIGLPWLLNSKTDLDVSAGPYAAFLGRAYDPVWTDFDGKGTRLTPCYTPSRPRTFVDPFGGTTPDGRLRYSSLDQQAGNLPAERLTLRRSLLEQFDRARRRADAKADSFDRFRQRAYAVVGSGRMRQALDIGREPLQLRE